MLRVATIAALGVATANAAALPPVEVEVVLARQIVVFHVRHHLHSPGVLGPRRISFRRRWERRSVERFHCVAGCREVLKRVVGIVKGQPKLTHVVGTLHPPSCFTSTLHSREQQPNEHADNRDHDEQFDECEGCSLPPLPK